MGERSLGEVKALHAGECCARNLVFHTQDDVLRLLSLTNQSSAHARRYNNRPATTTIIQPRKVDPNVFGLVHNSMIVLRQGLVDDSAGYHEIG